MERQTWRCLSVCLWELQMTHCHSFLLRTCRDDDAGVPLHLHAITQQIAFSLEAGKWNCLFSLLLHMWEGSRPCRDSKSITASTDWTVHHCRGGTPRWPCYLWWRKKHLDAVTATHQWMCAVHCFLKHFWRMKCRREGIKHFTVYAMRQFV